MSNCTTTSPTTRLAELSHEALLHITGPDSLKFLQGQTTCDTRTVDAAHAVPGVCCNPQGRALFDFLLIQLGPGHYALRMRRALLALALCAALSGQLAAQISVHDPAVTARNSVTAAVKELLLDTERLQHSQLRRMAQRLSLFTTLAKYATEDPPRWRTHGGGGSRRAVERRSRR